MIFRNLDAGGDWTFGKGRSNYLREERAIEMNIRTRILSWKGNCFFDVDAGVDWRRRLDFGQLKNLPVEISILILQSFGVVDPGDVTATFDPETRRMAMTYAGVETIFGAKLSNTLALEAGS
ncbi:MAG: hypothetical protein NTY77_05680 [Elusimicrobia bacterium]|nr:hypothetical protein [Elusimicrobiota bacterium]